MKCTCVRRIYPILYFTTAYKIILARQTVTRPRNESKGEKKARKSTVKQEKQARRIERKLTKEQFDAELVYQKKRIENREHSRLKKL